MSLRKIASVLEEEGHRTRNGRYYMPEQVRRMLRTVAGGVIEGSSMAPSDPK
jgi:hypothetical protein